MADVCGEQLSVQIPSGDVKVIEIILEHTTLQQYIQRKTEKWAGREVSGL